MQFFFTDNRFQYFCLQIFCCYTAARWNVLIGQAGCCSLQANWSFHPTPAEGLHRFESHFRPADTEVRTPISTGRFNYCKSAGFPSRCPNTNKSLRNGHGATHTCRLFVQVTAVESVLIPAETLVSNHTLTCSVSDSLLQIFACSNMTGKQTNKTKTQHVLLQAPVRWLDVDTVSLKSTNTDHEPSPAFKILPTQKSTLHYRWTSIDSPLSPSLQPPTIALSSGVSLQPCHSHFTHCSPSCQDSSQPSSSSLSFPITLLHFFWTFSPWTCHHAICTRLSCPVIPSLLFSPASSVSSSPLRLRRSLAVVVDWQAALTGWGGSCHYMYEFIN